MTCVPRLCATYGTDGAAPLPAHARDVAGASLIVEEAGGKVLDPSGEPFSLMGRRMLATNGHLAEQAAAVIGHMPLGPKEPRAPDS